MNKYIGWIILGTLILYLFSIAVPKLLFAQILLAWMVVLLVWRTLSRSTRSQAMMLFCAGLAAIVFSATHGVFLGWRQMLAINLPPLAMFVAVSFLALTNPDAENPSLPKGNRAVATTAIGTHLLGSVINLSILFVFGDRLQRKGALSQVQLITLARSFCAAAWWSPFFIATGVALTYAPEMLWKETLIPGAIMAGIAISYTLVEVCFFRKSDFYGYPLKIDSLTLPVFLAAVVILVHHFWHDVSILTLICVLSPAGSFIFMKGRPRAAVLHDFVSNRIASVTSQFALFLAAGVFSSGIQSVTHVYPALFHFEGSAFTPMLFTVVLGVMIIIGTLGVHPIISIAIVSPLLMPLHPDHSQLGFLFLTTWAVSTGSSPLSGVGLTLTSRYQASPRMILHNNWHYAVVMWIIASIANVAFFSG